MVVWELLDTAHRSSLIPNVVVYSAAIAACIYATSWCWSLVLLRTMAGDKVKPDIVICSNTVGACSTAANLDRLPDLLTKMRFRMLREAAAVSGQLIPANPQL